MHSPALTGFDSAAFLRDYWQKKPLLIRNPWRSWRNPLEPDELAGLACEREVESRLVIQTDTALELEHGPFAEDRFARLGAVPWTLLVQAADHHVPAVAELIEAFRFVPNWRIDDVMVSYATDEGGVGPHFDQYDVFLVQGLGRRRWRIGGACDEEAELLPHQDLRLLAQFEPSEEWILEPGDILYVPPRVAHDGAAAGDDCMTYSIGFRAPARRELIESFAESLLDRMGEDERYADPDLAPQANPGEIAPAALERLHRMISDLLGDREAFARWFAGFATAPRRPELDWRPDQPIGPADVERLAAAGRTLLRNPASRFAFVRQGSGALLLSVDGQSFACVGEAAALAERICAQARVEPDFAWAPAGDTLELLTTLINQGSLAFEPED